MVDIFGGVSVKVLDANGANTSTFMNVKSADTNTIADIMTRAGTLLTNLDAVMDVQIIDATLELSIPIPGGAKGAPVAGSDITQTGTLNFSDTLGIYAAPVVIPGLANAAVVGGKVDLTNADIIALKNFLLSSSSVLQIVSRALQVFVSLLDALFSFRKRRKAIARKSKP